MYIERTVYLSNYLLIEPILQTCHHVVTSQTCFLFTHFFVITVYYKVFHICIYLFYLMQ